MRLHRFYIPEIVGPKNEIAAQSASLVNQIQKVFRLKVGDSVIVFDNTGSDFQCKIARINKAEVVFHVEVTMRSRFIPGKNVFLFASIVKKDNFEWIVEKATELGVTHIIPLMSERSEKKSLNVDRLNKIVIEASEQSGRGKIPEISEIIEFKSAIETLLPALDDLRTIAFHTEGEQFSHKEIGQKENIAVFIGPEGGWSENEIETFHRNGIAVRCLGSQVLRAETAVIAALSQVIF